MGTLPSSFLKGRRQFVCFFKKKLAKKCFNEIIRIYGPKLIGKRFYLSKRHTTKRRRRSNQKHLVRKMFQQIHLGFWGGLRYESTPFVLRQYEGSTPKFLRSKYILAQTTFRQQKDNLNLHIWWVNPKPSPERERSPPTPFVFFGPKKKDIEKP